MYYQKLNESLKKQLMKKTEDLEIDVSELDSYHWDSNPYCVEPQLASGSGCGDWDENEEWRAKIQKMKKNIEEDGVYEYLDLADEDWDNQYENDCSTLDNECIYFLSTLEN